MGRGNKRESYQRKFSAIINEARWIYREKFIDIHPVRTESKLINFY